MTRRLKRPGEIGLPPRERGAEAEAPETPRPERQAAFRFGISAESRAAALLIAKGYRVVARRWRSPAGEIDIVCRRGRNLIFVEVKARERIDDAAWSLTPQQRRRILGAAEFWLSLNPADAQSFIRFDVMLVAPRSMPRHIENAFDASR